MMLNHDGRKFRVSGMNRTVEVQSIRGGERRWLVVPEYSGNQDWRIVWGLYIAAELKRI